MRRQRPRVLCVGGPTGVGKSALVEELFAGRGEVISADSMQVYRGLDIGTAKPGADARARMPHHLVDVAAPDTTFTVADFVRRADELVFEADSYGRIPIVSGGTAYYMRGFLFGVPETPPSNAQVRGRIEARLEEVGPEALHGELESVDPESAARISARDRYRLVRALEVYHTGGRPRSAYVVPDMRRDDIDVLLIGLYRERSELYARIDRRVEEMFRRGLIEEVRALLESGVPRSAPGFRGIGYREVVDALCGNQIRGDGDILPLLRLVQRNSRRYAKRQLTFFRRLPGIEWYRAEERAAVGARANDFLSRGGAEA